jgi:hypothetical protein
MKFPHRLDFARGLLADINPADQGSEKAVEIFEHSWDRYHRYLAENSAAFPRGVREFIEAYVLGKLVPKRLHDEIVMALWIGHETSCNTDQARLEMTLGGAMPGLRVDYLDVVRTDFPDVPMRLRVDRHEVLLNQGLVQHNIYVIGEKPIRLLFSDMRGTRLE